MPAKRHRRRSIGCKGPTIARSWGIQRPGWEFVTGKIDCAGWVLAEITGGESGIRTHVRVTPKHAFQACAFSHSAISPLRMHYKGGNLRGSGSETIVPYSRATAQPVRYVCESESSSLAAVLPFYFLATAAEFIVGAGISWTGAFTACSGFLKFSSN